MCVFVYVCMCVCVRVCIKIKYEMKSVSSKTLKFFLQKLLGLLDFGSRQRVSTTNLAVEIQLWNFMQLKDPRNLMSLFKF